ncbi:hypothetical protein ACFWY9_10170 [Amycolatopsis sp. NPDC059027]|uniref:hypothetical protein n=1 Tax=unclassified Amycolatopsis TaxID=2618356 RepID=UPI00366CFA01
MKSNSRTLRIHTLGPTGTNCEAAAHYYLEQNDYEDGSVTLYDTLEDAVKYVLDEPDNSALLGCIVYPQLNDIVFRNLASLTLRECFIMPTHRMVFARPVDGPEVGPRATVLCHPAPVQLLDGRDLDIRFATSNAAAASQCAAGESDACMTTIVAAEANKLEVLEDFGPVPMGFSIHVPHRTAS